MAYDVAPVSCPVCQSTESRVVDERVVDGECLRNVLCLACSHVYLNPRASETVYQEYYKTGFSNAYRGFASDADVKVLAANANKKAQVPLAFIAPFLKPGMRVLEIGAGFGGLSHALVSGHGITDLTAIEPDPQGARVAQTVYGLSVRTQTLEQMVETWDGKPFDLIIAHHVLEHFLDPHVFAQAVERLLAPEGVAYVGVPNVTAPSFPRKLFFRFPHVQNFSPFSLSLLFYRYGLKVVHMGPLTAPLQVMVSPAASSRAMVSWTPIVERCFPSGRILGLIKWYDVWHRLRLWAHQMKRSPWPGKQYIKKHIK